MKKLINLLRGYAQVRVSGAFPERLLNLCGQHRLPFWRLSWLDETSFTFRVPLGALGRLEELAERSMCQTQVLARQGGGAAARSLRRRWGFLLGLAICLAAVSVLSRFLLVVEVTGNETVPTAIILAELERLGVRPGAYGPGIDSRAVANQALIQLPQLSFLSINIRGSRAQVQVQEAVRPPELLDETTPADVVADADGIILDIQASAGRAMFSEGDIVTQGEVLISGELDLREPEGSQVDMGKLLVRAAGTVTARTWRTLEETIPLTTMEKTYTGRETTLYSLQLLWGQVDFFQNSSISGRMYDKITQTGRLALFGRDLPLGLSTTTLREYTLTEGTLDQEQAQQRLQALLLARLEEILEDRDGKVLRTDFVARIQDGKLTVTLLAECEEEIGTSVERQGETGRVYGEGSQPEAGA